MSDALPPLPVAAHHGNGDFALSVIPYYTAKQMHEFAAAAVRAALAQPTPQAAPTVPEGFKLVAVKGFDDLMYWLDRCERKGHLENCYDLIEPWAAFEYRDAAPQEPQR